MGMIVPYDINDTIKYTKIKLNELFSKFYSLNNDLKFILISVLTSYVLVLYIKDQLERGNKYIIENVSNTEPIYIDIDKIMYMYSGKVNVIKIIKDIHNARNILSHDYPTPISIDKLDNVFNQDDAMRELCNELGLQMQPKPSMSFDDAINAMNGI